MPETGGAIFANIPLIFAFRIAVGFTNNNGIAALTSVIAYSIME